MSPKPPPRRPQQSRTTGRGHRHNPCQQRREMAQSIQAKEAARHTLYTAQHVLHQQSLQHEQSRQQQQQQLLQQQQQQHQAQLEALACRHSSNTRWSSKCPQSRQAASPPTGRTSTRLGKRDCGEVLKKLFSWHIITWGFHWWLNFNPTHAIHQRTLITGEDRDGKCGEGVFVSASSAWCILMLKSTPRNFGIQHVLETVEAWRHFSLTNTMVWKHRIFFCLSGRIRSKDPGWNSLPVQVFVITHCS